MKKFFLWNEEKLSKFSFNEDPFFVEEFFNHIFNPYKVIYLSRARHFIPFILEVKGLKRNNLIFTQPYSSHCVLSSISLQSTPSILNGSFIDGSIIYHQYGYKTKIKNNQKYNNILMEDSVDSIFLRTTEDELFPNKSDINIISLSKIMKIPFGSIAICKNDKIYEELKILIDKNTKVGCSSRVLEELKNDNFFKEAILNEFKLLVPTFNVDSLYDFSISRVKENVNLIKDFYNLKDDFSNRLPSNIISEKFKSEIKIDSLIAEPYRHIYNYETGTTIKKQLIPVHCGISWKDYI